MNLTSYKKRAIAIARHPSNKGHWLGVMKRALNLRLAVLENRPVEYDFLNGTRIRCWPDTHASRDLAYYRIPDYPQMEFMLAYLKIGDNVLDVGANIGLYTVLAGSLVKPAGSVDSIEPVPETAKRLLANVALNQLSNRVRVHQLAVGNEAAWVEMTMNREATNHMVLEGMSDPSPTIRVQVGRLDDIAQQDDYAFGKIDVEGREWDAFKGAEQLLGARKPPIWIVEINGALFEYGHQVAPFVAWMSERGFETWMYEPESKVLRRARENVWGDVFFVARDRLNVLSGRIPGLTIVDS